MKDTTQNHLNGCKNDIMHHNGSNGTTVNGLSHNNFRTINLNGYVGFDKIAKQFVNKSVKDGFAFNILCIGETGIGKSTLIDTLFNTQFNLKSSTHHCEKVRLNSNQFQLTENGITLKLTVIETSGYGDQINKENSHQEIVAYVDAQYELYLQEELGMSRKFRQINDSRVHLCLYFLTPTGHSLKALDLNTMKALDRKVNILPILAKSDTIGKSELGEFKKRIMTELNLNGVNVYEFPTNENDSNVNNSNALVNSLYPLAIVGSSELVKVGTKFIRGRQYEWGVVAVENESHCDFVKLREMILSTNMLDLIELTHLKHYSLYRANRLREIGFCDDSDDENNCNVNDFNNGNNGKMRTIQDVYNVKRAELNEEIERKEREIKEEYMTRVKAKDVKLKEMEKEIMAKQVQLKKEANEWSARIAQKSRDLEDQIRDFSDRKFTLEKSKLSTLTSISGKFSKKK